MPQRIELNELGAGYIGGVPFAVALARGKRLVAFAATMDGDGLMEDLDDCRRAAAAYQNRLDENKTRVEN